MIYGSGVDEDTAMIYGSGVDENGLEERVGQHAVPSKQQVEKFQILLCEFEASKQIIDELRHSLKTYEHLSGCLESELLGVRQELDEEYIKRRHWETEFHRVNREVLGSWDRGADSRQFAKRPTDQRRGTPFRSDNMNHTFQGVRRDVQARQGNDREEGHPSTYNRRALPRRGMHPSFVQGDWRASRKGNNNTFRGRLRKRGEGCFKCDNFLNCKKGTCPAKDVTCMCGKVGHLPSKCWKLQE